MKIIYFLVAFSSTVAVFAGCATKAAEVPMTTLPEQIQIKKLERNAYVIEQQTVGRDCAKYIQLFPLPIWWVKSKATGTNVFSYKGTESTATNGAIYRALENSPDSDFLATPRYKIEYFSALPWYSKTCVEVKAKGARLKSDDELEASKTKGGARPETN